MAKERFEHRIDEILASAPIANAAIRGNYQLQYGAMTDWFNRQQTWNGISVIQGSLMVFGWMPTILEGRTRRENVISEDKADEVASALNSEIETAVDRCFVNRSPVGTSKFLPFWRPNLFGIWDSNVCVALTGSKREASKVTSFDEYTLALRLCATRHGLPIRQIEQRLFWFGRNA